MLPAKPPRKTAASKTSLEARIKSEGASLGLEPVRIASLQADLEQSERLATFVALGRHGDMTWMEETRDRRASPLALWPEAKSAVMVGISYAPDHDPLAILQQPQRGAISVYAQSKDYHDVLKPRLKALARMIAAETGAEVKVFVDTAPLMEKPLAGKAGVGWQGKHTNLVSRTHGSWLFLGAILTTDELVPDEPEDDHCGTCSRCLDACPTDAFPEPYQLDARRCIAYLTIEHRGHIPPEFRKAIGNRVFGCDDCLAVCPWNKFARASADTGLTRKDGLDSPPLTDLLALDDAAFRTYFHGTPVKRTGRDRIVRNALIAAGNSADPSLVPHITRLLSDHSALVRAMAVWALRQLATDGAFTARCDEFALAETDEYVRYEWQQRSPD